MGLSRHEIEAVAHTARLELTSQELDKFTKQINTLLSSIISLQELDTTNVEPTSHANPVYNVFRKDKIEPSLTPEEAVANGPVVAENCFVVPRVVES